MRKFIFFDLDGTLTDPGEGIANSVEYSLKKFGIAPPERTQLYKFVGPPLAESYAEYFGIAGADIDRIIDYYRERFSTKGIFENKLYEGIPELLGRLKKAGAVVCMATSKPEPFAIRIAEHFGIEGYFDYIAGARMDETRVKKDEVLAYAMETVGASAKESIMVGDREHDIIGAAKNGMEAVGVLYGYGTRQELEAAGALRIAAGVAELGEVLMAL